MRFYLDSMVWIYAFEGNPHFGSAAQSFIRNLRNGRHILLTSHFLLGELLVLPFRNNDSFLIAAYQQALTESATVEVVPFTSEVATTFAHCRAAHRTHQADSIHLALAASARSDFFVTVDSRLRNISFTGIGKIVDLTYSVP